MKGKCRCAAVLLAGSLLLRPSKHYIRNLPCAVHSYRNVWQNGLVIIRLNEFLISVLKYKLVHYHVKIAGPSTGPMYLTPYVFNNYFNKFKQ